MAELAGADRTALAAAANLVQTSLESGDIDSAIVTARNCAAKLRETRHTELLGFVLGVLAASYIARGNLIEALSTARDATPLLREQGTLFWLFDHLALRAALGGRVDDAALIAGYSDAVYQTLGCPREPMGCHATERTTSLLREALPAHQIDEFCRIGAQLSEDQVLSIALSA